jgi:carboxypeptidase Q
VKRTCAALVLVTVVASQALAADEPVSNAVVARIRTEGFQHSAVMDTLSWLTDVYGPRLTGSPSLRQAAEWARGQLVRWGIERAVLESYGVVGRGWTAEGFSIEMTEPQYVRITGYPKAWSPPTSGPIVGTPIVVDVRSRQDFQKYRGTLRGAIVMNGRPEPPDLGFRPEATRLTDEELKKQADQTDPAAPGFANTPRSFRDESDEFDRSLAASVAIWKFFAAEGVAALVTASSIPESVSVDGFYDREWRATYPAFVISQEQYGRIVRMLEKQIPVKLSIRLASRFFDNAEGINVIAEIPGTDPALSSQVVMLGAHLDSWHAATGATDDGAGCAAVLEAMRILKAIDIRPRRTIRLALWSGEEQDYLGSMGYVEKHFAEPRTMALLPEHAKLTAYFNLDNGGGRIRGVDLQGNEAMRPIFGAWLAPFHDLGAETLTVLNTGGTDHMPFDAVGLPAFQFIQDPLNYDTRTHHSNLDLYEEVVPDDLKQAAVIMASFVYHAAMRDEMLPRKPLPRPIGTKKALN